jgi:GT2 family glycosyltransferase
MITNILESINRIAYNNLEVIVIDNHSTDGTPQFLKDKKNYRYKLTTILREDNGGYVAINEGIEQATGKYLFFLNDDLQIKADCITELVTYLGDHPNTIVQPSIWDYDKKTKYHGLGGHRISKMLLLHKSDTIYTKPIEIAFLGLPCMSREVIKKIGGYVFDKDYFLGQEDIELCLRARIIGIPTILIPTAKVYHKGSFTTTRVSKPKWARIQQRNFLDCFYTTYETKNILIYSIPFIMTRIGSILVEIVNLRPSLAKAKLLGIYDFIKTIPSIRRKRTYKQVLRKLNDEYLFQVFD